MQWRNKGVTWVENECPVSPEVKGGIEREKNERGNKGRSTEK